MKLLSHPRVVFCIDNLITYWVEKCIAIDLIFVTAKSGFALTAPPIAVGRVAVDVGLLYKVLGYRGLITAWQLSRCKVFHWIHSISSYSMYNVIKRCRVLRAWVGGFPAVSMHLVTKYCPEAFTRSLMPMYTKWWYTLAVVSSQSNSFSWFPTRKKTKLNSIKSLGGFSTLNLAFNGTVMSNDCSSFQNTKVWTWSIFEWQFSVNFNSFLSRWSCPAWNLSSSQNSACCGFISLKTHYIWTFSRKLRHTFKMFVIDAKTPFLIHEAYSCEKISPY